MMRWIIRTRSGATPVSRVVEFDGDRHWEGVWMFYQGETLVYAVAIANLIDVRPSE